MFYLTVVALTIVVMASACDCPEDETWCDHDGECPGSQKCCKWGCGCRRMCSPPDVTEWPVPGRLTSRCQLPKVVGPCKARKQRFYFNSETRRCERFFYGGCCGNANNFKSYAACRKSCTRASRCK